MIAIPLDTQSATVISQLYGNAPFFALLDLVSGSFQVVKNEECGNGPKIVPFLKELGTSKTVFIHMGEKLFNLYNDANVEVFTCKDKNSSVDAIYNGYLMGSLVKLDTTNYKDLVDSDCTSCGCKY